MVQHISTVQKSFAAGDWLYAQTDEWPLRSVKHQLSVTFSSVRPGAFQQSGFGWGDTAINYRYQLLGSGESRLAVAPRITVVLPTGDARVGRGTGGKGLQANLPLSIQHNRWLVSHWNAGATWIPKAQNSLGQRANSTNVNLGQPLVFLIASRFNGLVETLWTSTENVVGPKKTDRRQDLYLSPGIRWAHNFSNGLQIVPGIGGPIGAGPSARQHSIIFYLSFEHPWRVAHSR